MNWQATAAITEMIGAAGVILSLIYLAKQIRMARISEKKKTRESNYLIFNDIRKSIYESEALSRICLDGLKNPESLNEYDQLRFLAVSETFFLNGEVYWDQLQLDEKMDERLRMILNFLNYWRSTQGGTWFWDHPQSHSVTPAFREVVENWDQSSKFAAGNAHIEN